MSWHCSWELEEAFSVASYLDTISSQESKLTTTADDQSCNANAKDTLTDSRSGMTCEPSTVENGEGQLMLFQVDSPARTFRRLEKVQVLPASVRDWSTTSSESLARLGLRLDGSKTHRVCVPVALATSSSDLPVWGMTHDGACWELGTSVRIIDETGCGFWPTHRANDAEKRGQLTPNPRNGLPGAVQMFPIPKARDWKRNGPNSKCQDLANVVRNWPTPQASDANKWSNQSLAQRRSKGQHVRLPTAVSPNGGAGGQLNPPWVEWLMGWPIGWTDLKPLGTDKYRSWQQSHGEYLRRGFCGE